MPPRRGGSTSNTLSPPEIPFPGSSNASPGTSPRSVSPSSGLTQLFSRPTKWFSRSNSANASRSSISSNEPRSSTSSTGRKPKISHPTDPRPIRENMNLSPEKKVNIASRSVLDLSLPSNPLSNDYPKFGASRTPSSPSQPVFSRGLGDLRSISRKPWSKSADDLGKLSSQDSTPVLTPIDTQFHEKVEQYRNRGGSIGSMSNAASPSPSSILSMQKNYPFPVISPSQSDPLSSSPPQRPSIQLSAAPSMNTGGAVLTPISSNSSSHVHTRSQSFTPRLPSKLASPKVSIHPPPSPNRKGSVSSERFVERDREKNLSGGSGGHGPSSRPPFPFSLGASGSKAVSPIGSMDYSSSVSPSPASLMPPKIVEPDEAQQEKRGSQLVYHSGFINRLVDFSPAAMNIRANYSYMSGGSASALSKGWKPFKLVLKGSKLYFYKPPSDRGAAVKDLFPTELVTVLEDEGLIEAQLEVNGDEEEIGRGGRGKDREDMRRRRAYWGRATHPSLAVVDGRIQRGSFEALVHESVFATTFLNSADDPEIISDTIDGLDTALQVTSHDIASQQADDSLEVGDRVAPAGSSDDTRRFKPDWRDFASTILLTLPAIVGQTKFETEFFRCCTFLVNGAQEDLREDERTKIRWLASEYLTYHGHPANLDSWEQWRKEIIPTFPADFKSFSKVAGIPQTSSTQALYAMSPQPNEALSHDNVSPQLGAFSPRPEDIKMMSIVEALGVLPPATRDEAANSPAHSTRSLQTTLEQDGLTRNALLSIDAQTLAKSLTVFHRRSLEQMPDNLVADFCFGALPTNNKDLGSLSVSGESSQSSSLSPFLGTDDSPHWLTRLILIQILVPEPAGSIAEARPAEDRHIPISRTHTRSEVISAWARIGELCRRTGDECSWRAIFSALSSRPIARLDKVWKRVDTEAVSFVQSWVQLHEKGDSLPVAGVVTIPWAGEIHGRIKAALNHARYGDEDQWRVDSLSEAKHIFESFRTTFALCSKRSYPIRLEEAEAEDVQALVSLWQKLQGGENTSVPAAKFSRIEQFMSLSLAAEPRRKGLFEPYYWTRGATQHTSHALVATLFPEPLPTVSFINRELLARGRLESTASVNMEDVQRVREQWLRTGSGATMMDPSTKGSGIDLGGTVLPLFDGELLLLVQPFAETIASSRPTSRTPSRPPSSVADSPSSDKTFSRSSSIRVTPGTSHGLDRKPSVARRNSLPSISQRTSLAIPEVSSDKSLRVVVQAGTLDRLVDVLVHGLHGVSVSVSDDNGEMPLMDSQTREVKVDMHDFSEVWWGVYRSFVTPQVLFEFLRKRYLSARLTQSPSLAEINNVVRIRSEVLETVNEWINRGGGAQDVLDDIQLYSSLETFLTDSPDADLTQCIMEDDLQGLQTVGLLDAVKRTIHLSFLTQTLRPSQAPSPLDLPGNALGIQNFGSETPDVDQLDPEDLMNNLDSMASAAFRNVAVEDLFVTADLLEVQSADRTGWFLSREPSSIADEVEIQFMSLYIVEVEPSAMISELTQDSLYRLLPPSVRSCIRAFGILRKWLISKLVMPRIGCRIRQARMELMLRAIEICRLRTAESTSSNLTITSRPCVRSFVEAVLTSAILSAESRAHYRAWQNIALARGTSCDSLTSLFNRPSNAAVTRRGNMTVDIGWILERMLEVISAPDVLDATKAESSGLVNFDKRRSLHALITSASGLTSKRGSRSRRHVDRRDYERLNNVEKEVLGVHLDLRVIREEAHREAMSAGPIGSKKNNRPFCTLVNMQQEKNRRDRHLRDRLSREKRQEQLRMDKREEYLNKAMNTRRQPVAPPKQHRNKKSMSSAFFQLMRPISSAFISDTLSSPGVKRTPAELDFVPSHKPSLVLSIADARVVQFVNQERSFTFQVDTEDGGHYLLQAISQGEMKKWMDTVQQVSKTAAKRRLTYLGQNSKVQLSDDLLSQPATASQDPRAVFGVDLDTLLGREAGMGEIVPGAIPSVLERLLSEVESRGLMEVGIYRIAGSLSEVQAHKDAINRGEWPITSSTDIHAVCDLIKSWFRVLPGGIFSLSSYTAIISAVSSEVDLAPRLSNIRKVVHELPDHQFYLLKRIVEHLDRVTDYEENNQMTAESLATVFGPNLLRSPNNDIGFFLANMTTSHRAMKSLIAHSHTIFDSEADHEVEGDQDHEQEDLEFDAPIPEEDEDADMLCDEPSEIIDDDDPSPQVSAEIPVLDVNLGSPYSLTFSVS